MVCGACVLWRFSNDNDYMWHIGYIAYLSARAIVEWLEDDSSGKCVRRCMIGHVNRSTENLIAQWKEGKNKSIEKKKIIIKIKIKKTKD